VLNQFNEYCENNKLIPEYQSAYRKNYSCETAVLKLVNDVLWSFQNKEITNLVFIDLSAAFNTVDYGVLKHV